MSSDIRAIQEEFNALVHQAGGDYRAAMLLDEMTYGFGPSRATVVKMRKGECKDSYLAMATSVLRIGLLNK